MVHHRLGFDLMSVKHTTGGVMRIIVDGAEVGTVDTSAAANREGTSGPRLRLDRGAHRHPRSSLGQVQPAEVIGYPGTPTTGIRHIDAGTPAGQPAFRRGAGGTALQEWLAAVSPSLVTVVLGANDCDKNAATYKINLANIVTKIRASGLSPDILLRPAPQRTDWSGVSPYADMVAAMCGIAEAGPLMEFLDLTHRIDTAADRGPIDADAVHPNDTGHARFRDEVLRAVRASLHMAQARTGTCSTESTWVPSSRFRAVAGTPARRLQIQEC